MIHRLSASQIRAQFVEGKLSAVEICKHFLKRIDTLDPTLGAFLSVYQERALKQATALDAKRAAKKPLGRLAAVPVALKDNIHVQGEMTTCGSRFLTNYRAVFNATVTEQIEHEDGLIFGKTNMDEFAMGSSTENSALQKTVNPWNHECSPGGSSGGSAVAVAARLCPLSLGSDTGGSIRQPAAFCGVAGFKPSYGRVSRYGLVAFASSLDQIGPFGQSSADIAMIMEVLGRHCPRDSTSLSTDPVPYLDRLNRNPRGMRVGIPWRFLEGLTPETKGIFLDTVEKIKSLGVEVVEIDLDVLKYSIAIYYILATAEASTNLARFDGIRYGHRSPQATTLEEIYDLSRQEGFGAEVKNRILLGTYVLSSGYQDAYYRKAQKVRNLIIHKYREAFERCDLIVTPTAPFGTFKIGAIQDPLQMYLQDIYTIGANLAGLPAISIPCGLNKEHKPIGLQITGAFMRDADVLAFAHASEGPLGSYPIPKGYDHD